MGGWMIVSFATNIGLFHEFSKVSLPNLAVFHFRIWQCFTSGFGRVLLPNLARW
jgi:hypothetical protein